MFAPSNFGRIFQATQFKRTAIEFRSIHETEMTYVPIAHRAHCDGCGAPLDLSGESLVECPYCGTHNRVIRTLRRAEPLFSWEVPQPESEPEPGQEPERWSFEQLLLALNRGDDPDLTPRILKAMDTWQQVNGETLRWLPALMSSLRHFSLEVDLKAAGIIGKFLCDSLENKSAVLEMASQFAFHPRGSVGLLRAIALADAAAVRLLLDVAVAASAAGEQDYAQEALHGVQTAIGRERQDRLVAVQILMHRLFDFDDFVSAWVTRFLRNQLDVGYADFVEDMLELYDEAVRERPDLAPPLEQALRKCRRPKNIEQLERRLGALRWLRSAQARTQALKLIEPSYPHQEKECEMAIEVLGPLLPCPEATQALARFAWSGDRLHPRFLTMAESPELLPEVLARALRSRSKEPEE